VVDIAAVEVVVGVAVEVEVGTAAAVLGLCLSDPWLSDYQREERER